MNDAEATTEIDLKQARKLALNWLGRREHSRNELYTKLQHKGCEDSVAEQVLDQLERERLLSDDRFIESLMQARRRRGYGPLRIRQELQEKGVAPEAIERWLDVGSRDWIEDLKRVRHKKFGGRLPRGYAERATQARFLQYRGFTFEQIQQVLNTREVE